MCVCDIALRLIMKRLQVCQVGSYNTDNNVLTFSMSGTILPTMCQLLVCRVQYCQQCVKFWW